MRIFSEPRSYLAAVASLPILLIVVNQTVAASLLQSIQTVSFSIWLVLIVLYLLIRKRQYLSKIRWITVQVTLETAILSAPLAYPMYMVFTQGSSYEYEGIFLAYLTLGIILMMYQMGRSRGVGSVGKIAAFLLAYVFSLMVYAGALAGQQTGSFFLLIVAFDQLFRVAALIGYPTYMIAPPLATYVRVSMALATPAIIFLALSAELEKSDAGNGLQKGGVKLTSSLRPAILLLTFAGASSLLLTLPLSLWLAESSVQLTTLLPPLGIAALLMLIIMILERRQGE